jgi:hypothetical protein
MAVKIPSKLSSLEYADDFYKKILAKLGAPITEGNMIFMKAWRQAEGGNAIYNPWNTIQGGYSGATKYNDKPGVKNYTKLEDGVDATYKTITNGIYPNIVAALKKGIKDKNEAYNLAVSLQKQGKDLWAWVNGPYSSNGDKVGYVAAVLAASKVSGKGIPIPLDSNPPPPSSNTISGKITDDKGQPVAGATVKIDPPKPSKLSDPILNPTTGKYEVKDENGNIIADSVDKEVARRKASNKVNANTVTTTSSTTTDPTSPSQDYTDGCPKSCDPGVVFSKIPPDLDSFFTLMSEKFNKCSKGCPPLLNELLKEKGPKSLISVPTGNIYLYFRDNEGPIRGYSKRYDNFIKKGTESDDYKFQLDESELVLKDANVILEYFKSPWSFDYGPNKPTQIVKRPGASDNSTETVTDKDGNFTLKPDVWNSTGTVTVSKEGHEVREITNIQQTSGDITGETGKQYDIPRFTIPQTPDPTATATSKINQEILTEETNLIKQQGNSELSAQERLANSANNKKEELKKTIIPFVIKLLAPFGAIALQAIISKIPLDKILDQIQCPTQDKLLELINKRNKLVRQINNIYKTINTLTKALSITSTAITAIQAGITVIEALPYPATGIPPLGLPPLTSGIIEITGTGKDKLKEALKKANVIISIVTLSLAAFGAVLGIVLRLLNSLDALIQQCAQEQDVPFEIINNELNIFVNQSTGVSNSAVIASDNTYKGFTLEIKLDESSTNKYPRRFAQALTKQGIPVLKTDSSFASDPQVLLDQLKFIIDSNPQLTAE